MAFFYVKAGGTATGNGGRTTTARTGTWNATASEYYDTLSAALSATTPPVSGDWLVWSDASSDVIVGDTTVNLPDGVNIITVDDSNQDTYSKATSAQINNSAGNDYELGFAIDSADSQIIAGANIVSGDTVLSGRGGNTCIVHEFTLGFSATTGDLWQITGSDCDQVLAFKHVLSPTNSDDHVIQVGRGGSYAFLGGSQSNCDAKAFQATTGGSDLRCYGRDLSGCSSAIDLVTFSGAVNNSAGAYFYRCKLPANWTIGGYAENANYFAIVESCDSEYQYDFFHRSGEVEFTNHATNFVHSDDDFLSDGSTRGSYKFTTDATECGVHGPLFLGHMRLPRWLTAENTESATKTKVRVKFASATADTLDDSDIIVYVMYPNGTNTYLLDAACHFPEPLKAGAALSTQSGKWSGAGTENQYYLDVPMTSPGDGLVMVWVGFTIPGKTIYLSPQIEFVE